VKRLLVAVVLGTLSSTSAADVVGIDARSTAPHPGANPATDPAYGGFRAAFTSAGHSVQSLVAFTPGALAALDLLVLTQPTEVSASFSAAEIADIQSFVSAGGRLLFLAEAGWDTGSTLSDVNSLLVPYGLAVSTLVYNGSGAVVKNFITHDVTEQVTEVGLDFHRTLIVASPAVDLTIASVDVLATVDGRGGSGRVVVFTDRSGFANSGSGPDYGIGDLDNLRLLENIVDWLLPPFGTGCPGAGGFVPKLSASSTAPTAGGPLTLSLTHGLGGATATFFIGLSSAELPMVGGCTLNISPLLPVSITVPLGASGAGHGWIDLPGTLPLDMSGVTFAMQAFVLDSAVAHGFSNSNEVVIAVQ